MEEHKLFINGEYVDAKSGETFESIDPGTGIPFAKIAKAGTEDVEAAIHAARAAFDSGVWSDMDVSKRSRLVMNFADHVSQIGLQLSIAESMDSGQVMGLAKFMPMMGSNFLRNMAHYAMSEFPWTEEIPVSGNAFSPGRDYIRREPIGVCVGIIPWNFPIMMAFWKIASAIVMGNTIVLKPATSTPVTALMLGQCVKAAGIPDGVVNIITGPGGALGKALCTHPEVDKLAFTGSTEVGTQIMKMASDGVKKVTLELGGKSANIILDDADMDLAVEGSVYGTFYHQGQVCESGTRVLVSDKIYDEFIEKMKERTEKLRIGYQLEATSHQGPLANAAQLATVEQYVKLGQEEGATLLIGGKKAEIPGLETGYYYEPTIFIDVKNSMRIAKEEIFGPVVCVMKFSNDEEAVAIANDSKYGLGGGIFSQNTRRAEELATKIRTGTMWINNYHSFGDYCPFGGYKQSGIGRELGHYGLAEYTEIKRVHVSANPSLEANLAMQIISDKNTVGMVNYRCPTAIIGGHGCLAALGKELVNRGCERAMIMTDQGVRDAGLEELVKNALAGFYVGTFDNIAQDTDLTTVDEATDLARQLEADCIISVGGGSVIDTAKAVCVTLKNGGAANDHIATQRLYGPQTPHFVIPTTSGTGSEVTNVAVIKSNVAGRKVYIVDPWIAPDVAILDPRFTMSLPESLTVTTAMDAMTHAVEALTSIMSNPICDGQALHAIRLIAENLPKAVANGQDETARQNLQYAASMAGCAFTIAQVGLAHAMAHTLGMLYELPHGMACGLMLPGVMRYNIDHAPDKLAAAAQALGVNTTGMSDREAGLAAADAVEELMKSVGHPLKLNEVGIPEDGMDMAAFHAIADLAALFNAKPVRDPGEIAELYKQLF